MRTALFAAAIGLACLTNACVMQSTYDKDLADLNAAIAKNKQESTDTLDAAGKKCAQDKAALEAAAIAAAKAAADKAAADTGVVKRDLDACVAAGGDKGKALLECTKERDAAKDRLARVQASIDKVKQALQSMAAAGKLEVKERSGFLIIALAGDILFDIGKAKLKEEASGVLRELANILKLMADRGFQVAGHSDDQGDEEKNWSLSMERALTVVRFLIKEGVPGKSVSAGGYAFYQPTADNATPEGRTKNRRVEFMLMPNLSELLRMGK